MRSWSTCWPTKTSEFGLRHNSNWLSATSFAELLKVAANTNAKRLARVHALWGLGQLEDNSQRDKRLARRLPFTDSDFEIRAQAAKLAGTRKVKSCAAKLADLLHDENSRVQFHAAMALGQAGDSSIVPGLIALLERNDDRDAYLRHAAIMGLAGSAGPAQLSAQNKHESAAVRVAAVATLRRLKHPGVKSFLADSSEWVLREAVSAVHDDESIPEALPAVADLLPSSTSQSEAITRRLLSANLRVGKAVNAERLLAYALDQSKPSAMRAEALLCLGDWNRRPFVDRVEGRVRELSKRDDSLAGKLILANLQDLFEASDSELLAELIRLCEKLQIKLGAKSLLVIAKSESQDLSARVQAVQSVQVNKTQDASDQLIALLKSKHPEIQVAAVSKLAEIEPKTFARKMENNWRPLSLPAQQTFLSQLGTATSARGDEIVIDSLASLLVGELTKALELDVITSAKARQTPKLKQLIARYESRQSAEDPVASYRSTLVGGQPAKGKLVYDNHVAAQCVRCHSAGGKGNQVGA